MALNTIYVLMDPPVWTLLELLIHLYNQLPGICIGIAKRCFKFCGLQTVILIFCTPPTLPNRPFSQLLRPESLWSPLIPQCSHPTSRPSAGPTWLYFQNMFPQSNHFSTYHIFQPGPSLYHLFPVLLW